WIAGAGLKARPESEVEIARFDMIRAELWRRRPGGGAIDEMTREQQRLAYQELSERYPWGDAVIMGRKDEMERDDRMVWSVFNRLPPNNDAYLDAVGLDPRLLDMFYTEGLEAMSPAARKEFVGKMQQLYAILALPADATVQEWNEAKNAIYAMKATLAREFGDAEGDLDNIYELQNTFFDIRDKQS